MRRVSGIHIRSRRRNRDVAAGYLFILPTLALFVIFVLLPIFGGIGLSFATYNMFKPPKFAGLSNYATLFKDPVLLTSYLNTFYFAILAIAGNVGGGLLLALLVNRRIPRGLNYFFRFSYFLPVVISTVYVAIVWFNFFATDTGIFNYYLGLFHIRPVRWLTDTRIAMISIIILDVWKNVGFFMVVFLAALQNIPRMYYEAAELDGASAWVTFRRITFPLLSPTVFFNVTIVSINALQVFDAIYILTEGGPRNATRSVVIHIYQQAFQSFKMGYASSMAITLFILISLITLLQFRLSRLWVNY